ncbi:Glucans biosynthesis glucosyltransferase H [Hartmannibacter diazotrophicus]|uniref:Glucans biosynthesis glucosyltransferase H n=1 Tax=Hartmannibacter diazotrophicus TaxID=1482074 RepID=A0A2C9DBQ6_9HYPH|nr:glucans biosynthesis glucosyltransferase MdoH [Hartmannibacter diazotrophicus]SON57568.1 Glucans biosynthesis glucosyltransferase H [Hartmannibacter diazotrophicus]
MDGIKEDVAREVICPSVTSGGIDPGMPAESPRDMPAQRLERFDYSARRTLVNASARSSWTKRFFVLGGALALSIFAIYEMYLVLSIGDLTPVEQVVLGLFALTFVWIAIAMTSAIAGFAVIVRRRFTGPQRSKEPLKKRTAVLMPTYNEQPDRVFAELESMIRAVDALGEGDAFDWFVIADTTDAAVALQEEEGLALARQRLGGRTRLFYRRRRQNTGRKAGNVADFCRRWGGAYEHLLVLDADSLMDAETMVELARRMEADPDAGLIQTIPVLVGGTTLMARIQQFAGRVYGPVVGTGLSWWVQKEGNFWGHNAIIRTEAFTNCAGLPDLPGAPPFGGHIMSHDFVEAALIRRGGWNVIIADDLSGSFEESPPSLIDLAVRDRRWCQGNLQHSRLIAARGLHWVSRSHLLTGILSYATSPLWLMLLIAGLVLALQAHFIRPEYFSSDFQLFPSWPRIDPERALGLFVLTMGVLFTPKILGLVAFLSDGKARKAAGGFFGVLVSFLAEMILSALVAPIMMLIHTGAIVQILLRRDAGWNPQRRDDGGVPLTDLIRRHKWHVLSGFILGGAALADSWILLAWLSPAVTGLILAVPLSGLTGSASIGRAFKKMGILRIPEESNPPPIREDMLAVRPSYEAAVLKAPSFAETVSDPDLLARHLAFADRVLPRRRGAVDPVEAMAAAKIGEAESIREAATFLNAKEEAIVLATPRLLQAMAALPEVESPKG